MKNYKQPLLTILVIFATAYMLTIIGCAPSGGGGADAPAQGPATSTDPVTPQAQLQPVDVKTMRECTQDEYSRLQNWSFALIASDKAIKSMGISESQWKLDRNVAQVAMIASAKCDAEIAYHTSQPCKKIDREITRPDLIKKVTGYDAYNLTERCEMTQKYVTKFDLRPRPSAPTPAQPIPQQPSVGSSDPVPANLRQCSADEFMKLKAWRTSVDLANMNIAKLNGAQKYDTIAIDAAKTATLACEPLIAYHQSQPCQREKPYTASIVRDQCKIARTYYYNFVQRTDSLQTVNARLYLDTSVIANKTFRPGLGENSNYGNCSIENKTSQPITYAGQKALVTESRVYTNSAQEQGRNMFVFQTQEGLKFSCYGMEYSSAATSRSEVVKLLAGKQTNVPLFYELN